MHFHYTFTRSLLAGAALALLASPGSSASAQAWRRDAAGLGTTARVLIIGTHPEDEDNALFAWLSLGRNIETAYLSLTRGENGSNIAGAEREFPLGAVRTAELSEERKRDGAHQYFTRAYDFGFARSDSMVSAAWPHDSLLKDVVSVVRAFRPHVVVSLFSDSGEADATHREAARLAREAFDAAADSVRFPPAAASLLAPWTVARLFTRVDSASASTTTVGIDVGELDRASGRSYAELGAEIRRLQRTQPSPRAPGIGRTLRFLRLDRARPDDRTGTLFTPMDTAWARLRGAVPAGVQPLFDSLDADLAAARAAVPAASADSLAIALARVAHRAEDARAAIACPAIEGVPRCAGALGDVAASLDATRARAERAFAGAAGIVLDGAVEREVVATGDSVPLMVTLVNGGGLPIVIRRLTATSGTARVTLAGDSAVLHADSIARWPARLRVLAQNSPWWQVHGLSQVAWIHVFRNPPGHGVIPQLISGEDRIAASGVEGIVSVAGIDVPIVQQPLVYRAPNIVRGDARHPLTGLPAISVLFERAAEYERAGLRVDRLLRVFLSSAHDKPDTVSVSLQTPAGIRADSSRRIVVLPARGARNVFFHLRGVMKPGQGTLAAEARLETATRPSHLPAPTPERMDPAFTFGAIERDYPHIPTQFFIRPAQVRIEATDLRVPPRLRVAYIRRGDDDLPALLGQLRVNVQVLDPVVASIADLSAFSTILIGADAFDDNYALAAAVPALHEFMRRGGTVVVLPGETVARSGLLPYPVAFESVPGRVSNPQSRIALTNARSPLLTWPNVITERDFDDWKGDRARGVPAGYDTRYRTVLSTGDDDQPATAATILAATIGKGALVYTSLSLDRQLAAVNPGAARLLVNLLSAGLFPRKGAD